MRHTNCVLKGIWTDGNAGNSYASHKIYGTLYTQLNASVSISNSHVLFAPPNCTPALSTENTNTLQIIKSASLNQLLKQRRKFNVSRAGKNRFQTRHSVNCVKTG